MVHHLYFDPALENACRFVTGHHLGRGESHFHSLQGLPKSHEPRSAETAPNVTVSVWACCDLFRFAYEARLAARSKAEGPKAMRG